MIVVHVAVAGSPLSGGSCSRPDLGHWMPLRGLIAAYSPGSVGPGRPVTLVSSGERLGRHRPDAIWMAPRGGVPIVMTPSKSTPEATTCSSSLTTKHNGWSREIRGEAAHLGVALQQRNPNAQGCAGQLGIFNVEV